MSSLLFVRRINRASIEHWSSSTYRRVGPATADTIDTVRAAEVAPIAGVPDGLFVPRRIPSRLRLGLAYEAAYYLLAGAAFKVYSRSPIHADAAWDASVSLELKSDEGWNDIIDDVEFAQLRLQGSNPFLLKRAPDGESWTVDYSQAFRGVHEPVVCDFAFSGEQLLPRSIRVGADTFRPGDAGWKRAKLIANALDARYTVFVKHLLGTHFLVGQNYALAAAALPPSHPLRAFMDVHTYGTLHVNAYAWKLVLTPTSYFIQSKFIDAPSALQLLQNGLRDFRFDSHIPARDAAARGLDTFPNHPYFQDAQPAWDAMRAYCTEAVASYTDDASVRSDPALRAWHSRLLKLFPAESSSALNQLETRDDLVMLLTVLVFNNVIHEVSGDFSPYTTSVDPYIKRLVNFETFARDDAGPVRLNDVFLFEQGAFSGMFNTAGNNMIDTPLTSVVSDKHFLDCNRRFREALLRLDSTLTERNTHRRYHFRRLLPKQWEMSVSF